MKNNGNLCIVAKNNHIRNSEKLISIIILSQKNKAGFYAGLICFYNNQK